MGLKKRSKVSAEFSMSSLTDIIFLLLIFFMLTSSIVTPNALNLKLPGKSKAPSTPSNVTPLAVTIDARGTFYINGSQTSYSKLNSRIRSEKKNKKNKATVTIKPNGKAPSEKVVQVMDLCFQHGVASVMSESR